MYRIKPWESPSHMHASTESEYARFFRASIYWVGPLYSWDRRKCPDLTRCPGVLILRVVKYTKHGSLGSKSCRELTSLQGGLIRGVPLYLLLSFQSSFSLPLPPGFLKMVKCSSFLLDQQCIPRLRILNDRAL